MLATQVCGPESDTAPVKKAGCSSRCVLGKQRQVDPPGSLASNVTDMVQKDSMSIIMLLLLLLLLLLLRETYMI